MAEQSGALEVIAMSRVPEMLSKWLRSRPDRVRVRPPRAARQEPYDFAATVGSHLFMVEVASRADPPTLKRKWGQVRAAGTSKGHVPLLVVPYMPATGRAFCEEGEINWLDLSGNGSVQAPGLAYQVQGIPNQYARRGRPASVFERRSSRLARLLLQSPGRTWSVRECALLTTLDEGHVSRIVARLVEDELLVRGQDRRFHVPDPGALLEAWRAATEFSKHRILPGHVPARSGEELLRTLSDRLGGMGVEHAATGLGAAWLYDHFAMFRLVTLYVREWFTDLQLERLHFQHEAEGANVWLVLPNDDGVFTGMRTIESIPCVHPVQVFIDLKDQPERAAEAAEHLRSSPALFGDPNGA